MSGKRKNWDMEAKVKATKKVLRDVVPGDVVMECTRCGARYKGIDSLVAHLATNHPEAFDDD